MESSPAVLSLGKLVQEKGFSFEWKPGRPPSLQNDKGQHIKVEVKDLVPMIASPVLSCPVQQGGASSSSDGAVVRGEKSPTQSSGNRGAPSIPKAHEVNLDPYII